MLLQSLVSSLLPVIKISDRIFFSAQSDTSKGMTKKLLPEFDPEGFQKMHNMMTKYGTAYFSMSLPLDIEKYTHQIC